MKNFLYIFIFLNYFSFAQSVKVVPVDSTYYFIKQANTFTHKNNFKNSLFFAQKAIDYASTMQSSKSKSDAYATMGYIYYKINKTLDAIPVLEKSIANFDKNLPIANQASVYYLIGMCHIDNNQPQNAENYFEKAQKIYQQINNPGALVLLNLQKGIVCSAKGKIQEARNIFLDIIFKSENVDDLYKTKSEALYQIGNIEFRLKKYILAINYLNRSLAANNNDIEQKCKILLVLSNGYEKIGDINKSFDALKKHLACQENINNVKYSKIVADDYNQFKENERIKEINQIDKILKEKEKSTKFARLISILAIALISILSLLSLSLYKNSIIRNKNNDLLKAKNNELFIAKNNAEKAMKARSDFLSTVSHELRTPLNAINGLTHLLIEENPKQEQIEYLNSLKFSGNYLLTFINEILEANRIDANKIEVENINFNLIELTENILNSLKEIATKNNNIYDVFIDKNIPEKLIGDPIKLSQILINLVNNSLKFTTNGFVKIALKQLENDNEYCVINFRISDTGIGINQEQLTSIFDSFSQGSIEINRKYGGTGLGLTIVKNLVEVLGGEINVKSQIDKGSEFYFNLKFKINNEPKVEKIVIKANHDVMMGKKILLVEDNKINQMITKKMLENKQIICEIVENGEEAIKKVKSNSYDLVLMDVHLPGINGTIATQEIRLFDKKTPIIALTAISLNENKDNLMAFGMNEVITKPFNPEHFYDVISEFISS